MLTGDYKEEHFSSMGATQAAEWERQLCEYYTHENEKETKQRMTHRVLYIKLHIKTRLWTKNKLELHSFIQHVG